MGVGFVSSRTLATDRDWLFGVSVVVVEGSLSFTTTFTSTFHRPFSVQKSVVLCRCLYIDPFFSSYCSRALRSSCLTPPTLAVIYLRLFDDPSSARRCCDRSTARSRPATSTTSHPTEPRHFRILHSARQTRPLAASTDPQGPLPSLEECD